MDHEKKSMNGETLAPTESTWRPYALPAAVAMVALSIVAVSVFGGRSLAEEGPAPAPGAVTSVELTPAQSQAIRVETVGTYRFAVERHAPGSISFEADPALVQGESTLLTAAAAYDVASKELVREDSLGTANGLSQKQLEQAASDKQTAQAALAAARQALRVLGKTDAEMDAMVAAGHVESAPAGEASARWAVAYAAEDDAPLLKPGQPARIVVSAFPGRSFGGSVAQVYGALDPDTHRVTFRCRISDPDHALKPGMLADVYVEVQKPVESVVLPDDGVVREGDGTMTAWVTTDGRHFSQRVITVGLEQGGKTQILTGLKAGERAVVEGAIFLDNMLQAPVDD